MGQIPSVPQIEADRGFLSKNFFGNLRATLDQRRWSVRFRVALLLLTRFRLCSFPRGSSWAGETDAEIARPVNPRLPAAGCAGTG